ncbi:MAG: hypothetical protein IT269_04460 [Saprospiraceae bacterium]|nr:hypothetical protein [Saprospiraceae bacterium]
MNRSLLLLSLCLAFVQQIFSQEMLSFVISPTDNPHRLSVVVRFPADGRNMTKLDYEDNQFGEPGQMRYLDFPTQAVEVIKRPDSNYIEVKHSPQGMVEVRYSITDLQANTRFYEYCCYNPIIHDNYFHVQAGHLILEPMAYWGAKDVPKNVRFEWRGFPEGYVTHHSFGPDRVETTRISYDQINSAVFVGGDFRRYSFKSGNVPVHFLVRGKWTSPVEEDQLKDILTKTVAGHLAFWQDNSDSLYSVSLIPVEDSLTWTAQSKSVSLGGSGLTNSFMSYATNNPGLTLNQMRYLYVHELMHHWVGNKLQNEAEEKQYWFSEGFTEYFTLKNSLRYGLIDVNTFIKELNDEFAVPHSRSPYKTAPNDSMNYRNFWSGDREWEKLPYRRGCLYAFYLDNQIREHSGGKTNLDDFMRHLLKQWQANPKQRISNPYFTKELKHFAGKKSKRDFKRFIEKGEEIPFPRTTLPTGMRVDIRDITMQYGPSKDVVERVEVVKNVLFFLKMPDVSEATLKEALLR